SLRPTAGRSMPTGTSRTGGGPVAPPWWRTPWVMATGVVVLLGAGFGGYKLLAKTNSGSVSPAEAEKAKQIAVLYFDNPENDSTLTSFADGLTDGLIKTLRQAGLVVRPGTSVAPYRGKDVA